ncbi:MAG: (5-formylfuran-3-yl)methyl phosphate synthase, partial [Planctomycetota bacterium]
MSNSTACQLLVSANTLDECKLLLDLKVPWVDLKDPRQGPLGRP